MTLADLESFVTGPVLIKRDNGLAQMHPPLAQKRKPQHSLSYDDPYNVELFRMTVSKILSQPVRRVEPSLKRFLLLKNLWKDLQCNMSSELPCKRISLDIEQPSDVEMLGESSALQNLHLTCDPAVSSQSLLHGVESVPGHASVEPSLQPSHFVPSCAKESTISSSIPVSDAPVMKSALTVIEEPTELVDMLPSYDSMDFQSLVQCSMDQMNGSKSGSVDELDNIMQVLVSM
ncbi:uncharacterized protein [Watersipora subatra]|uniref:uncharacterized protein n=1 Tax=Watersipora subatra TaxID=2589382 RepID=UPI00355C3481